MTVDDAVVLARRDDLDDLFGFATAVAGFLAVVVDLDTDGNGPTLGAS